MELLEEAGWRKQKPKKVISKYEPYYFEPSTLQKIPETTFPYKNLNKIICLAPLIKPLN